MHIDAPLRYTPLAQTADEARRLERLGFDTVWTFETAHDPFLPLVQAALATERLHFGTNIAVAFARSPFATALVAWDLQRASAGRLHLGLGTQVRAHVERRFSAEFDHPAARVTDYIRCVRAIWSTFQEGTRPSYEGPFYRFTLINDFFHPGPIDHPTIPIALAGVNERMARAAGEVADGFAIHPLHSAGYVRDVVRPAVAEGARREGRSADDVELHAAVFLAIGETEAERSAAEAEIRQQVAFYASTPSYRRFLEYHGLEDVGKRLSQLMRQGDVPAMVREVPDALLAEVAVCAPASEVAAALRERYDGLVQRLSIYFPVPPDDPQERWTQFTSALRV